MRALPSLRRIIGVATVSLLLLPAAAAAATDATTPDAAENDAPEQDATGSGVGTGCDEPLITFTRDATTGDDRAVAITAQSIEQGAPGWEMVGWQSAAGTQLTAVLATDRAGGILHLGTAATGIAEQVTSLTFCGTAADPSDDSTEVDDPDDTDAADPDLAVDDAEDTDDTDGIDDSAEVVVDPAAGSSQPEQATSDTDEPATATEHAPASPETQTPVDELGASADTAAPTSQTDTTGTSEAAAQAAATGTTAATDETDETDQDGTTDEADEGDEVEVLGVRIVATADAEDDTDDNAAQDVDGGAADRSAAQPAFAAANLGTDRGLLDSAWLLAAAIAAGIAAGGSAIRYRCTAASNATCSGHSADSAAATPARTTGSSGSTDTVTSNGQHGEDHR